jgi:hypothetical protein
MRDMLIRWLRARTKTGKAGLKARAGDDQCRGKAKLKHCNFAVIGTPSHIDDDDLKTPSIPPDEPKM